MLAFSTPWPLGTCWSQICVLALFRGSAKPWTLSCLCYTTAGVLVQGSLPIRCDTISLNANPCCAFILLKNLPEADRSCTNPFGDISYNQLFSSYAINQYSARLALLLRRYCKSEQRFSARAQKCCHSITIRSLFSHFLAVIDINWLTGWLI